MAPVPATRLALAVAASALVLLVAAASAAAPKLPKSWKTCKRSDPALGACLKPAVQQAILELTNGSQSLGVLPLDPLHFNVLNIDQPGNGPVSLNLTFYQVDITGVRTLQVDNVLAKWEDPAHLEVHGHLDEPCMLIGDYSIDGNVLILPIRGNGQANLTFVDFKFKLVLDGAAVSKKDKQYLEVKSAEFWMDTSRLHTHLSNLFNGDQALGDNMNKFLNDNWSEILNELKGSISKAFGQGFQHIANAVFRRIPLTTIAPP